MADFPLYRKYRNHKTWFKVESPLQMKELKVLGDFYNLTEFTAQTFVDRNFISDLMENADQHWEEITAAEFEKVWKECEQHRQLRSSL